MTRYKKLILNTLIFGLGNFGSKLLQFILLPFYTHELTASQYGTVDIIVQTASILVPLVTLSIYEAILRFVMDKDDNHKSYLKTSTTFTSFIFAVLGLIFLIVGQFVDYEFFPQLYLVLLAEGFRTLFAQYVRARGNVKAFSISGIVQTFVLAAANIVFLKYFKLGVNGYLYSIIISNIASILVLIISESIVSDFLKGKNDHNILKIFLSYSIPLVPNSIMWWTMNASNRYFITYFHGIEMNGIFAVASKIPSALTMFLSVFIQAWQMSAIEEYNSSDKETYFEEIKNIVQTFIFFIAICIIFTTKIFWKYIAAEYSQGLYYVTPIMLGVIFSSLSAFYGSFYLAAKKTSGIMSTTVLGSTIGIILNLLLIPSFGAFGAALSTLVSFFIVYLMRVNQTKNYIKINFSLIHLLVDISCVILASSVIYLKDNMLLSALLAFGAIVLFIINNINQLKILIDRTFLFFRKGTRKK